jgi:CheY-like chemotaxis protein
LNDGERLQGLRVLIIEDESMIAMLIEDTLIELGCVVAGVASRLDDAISQVSSVAFDAAILDVNLNGCPGYPLAEALSKRSIPFLFSTGSGAAGVREKFRGVPTLGKPFQQVDLERALVTALTRNRGTHAP